MEQLNEIKLKNNFDKYMHLLYSKYIAKDQNIMSAINIDETLQELVDVSMELDSNWDVKYFGSKANMALLTNMVKKDDGKALVLYSIWYKYNCSAINDIMFMEIEKEYMEIMNKKKEVLEKDIVITTTTRNIAKAIIFIVGIGAGLLIAKHIKK